MAIFRRKSLLKLQRILIHWSYNFPSDKLFFILFCLVNFVFNNAYLNYLFLNQESNIHFKHKGTISTLARYLNIYLRNFLWSGSRIKTFIILHCHHYLQEFMKDRWVSIEENILLSSEGKEESAVNIISTSRTIKNY